MVDTLEARETEPVRPPAGDVHKLTIALVVPAPRAAYLRGMPPEEPIKNATPYESPKLMVIGTVRELTQFCFFGKALGHPDYFDHIPITNCSS